MQNKIKNNSGFTLIETLVALFILSLVITSVISLLSSNIFAARYAKNEIKATYIAQEGIDYLRNLRDSVAFLQNDWATFSSSVDTSCAGVGCEIDKPFLLNSFLDLTVSPAQPPATPLLPGEFRNTIVTECVDIIATCDEIKITSTVEWENGEILKSRSIEASLTKWN